MKTHVFKLQHVNKINKKNYSFKTIQNIFLLNGSHNVKK